MIRRRRAGTMGFLDIDKEDPMKRWIKRSLFAAVGLSVLAGGLAACSHAGRGHGMAQASAEDIAHWRARLLERAGRELQLDAPQTQRLGQLFDALDAQRVALVAGSADPRAAMQALVGGERFDRERANALLSEKTEAVRLKSPQVITAAADFFDGLRADQQAKVRALMAERRHGWRG